MRTCKEISELVSASLDQELPFRQRMAVRVHLVRCSMCRAYEKQARFLRSALRSLARPQDEPSEHLPEEAARRIKKSLSSNDE